MSIHVDIQVQDGKVIITVGGQPSAKADAGKIVAQGNVGGAAAADNKKGGDGLDDTDPGAGGPSSGALVIGPIVVDGAILQGEQGQANASARKGGDGLDDTDPGAGGPSSGALVIGPIVIGGRRSGQSSVLPRPQSIDIGPPEPRE